MWNIDQKTRELVAPTGRLRVGIAVGSAISAVWATRDNETGEPRGPTVDLARLLAARIGAPLELIEYPSSGAIVGAASSGDAHPHDGDRAFQPR